MAPADLDKLWDEWLKTLSASYVRTLDLLEAGKPDAAHAEYRSKFVQTVKELYAKTASTTPARFSKIDDWPGWARALYAQAINADRVLGGGRLNQAHGRLAALREHFYRLHKEAGTRKVNDYIFAFHDEANKEKPSLDKLRSLRNVLEKATPSAKARDPKTVKAFRKARAEWGERVAPLLAEGATGGTELERLRSASEVFYHAFGREFE